MTTVAMLLIYQASASPHGTNRGRSDVGSRLAAAQGELHHQASVGEGAQSVRRREEAPAPEIESNEEGAETFSLAKGLAKP